MQEKIDESNVGDMCHYWTVTRYIWKGVSYIDFFSPISSCLVCEVYYENGLKVEWDADESTEYMNERTTVAVLWECEL